MDVPDFAWLVIPRDRGASLLGQPAEAWIEMALMICLSCPAQYDCARFAIATEEQWGTWGMHIEDLEFLRKRLPLERRMNVIDVAEDLDIPVQVAVRRVHDEHAMSMVG